MNESPNEQENPADAAVEIGNENPLESQAHRVFCAYFNHKLRTPLNAILGYAELLALQPGGRRDSSDLQQILKSAREMLVIIQRDLAHADGGEVLSASALTAARVTPTCDLLYVEDDIVNYTLVERILEFRPKVKLMHAPDGKTGIELAAICQPKMVLLDLNLPDMDGSEVLRSIQQNEATAKIPVVILSANATPSRIERLLTAGAKNYLTKPFDIDPFLAVVDEFTAVR